MSAPQALANVRALKVNGAGNAFYLIDDRPPLPLDRARLAALACAQPGSLAADGVLFVQPPPPGGAAVATMRIFNADGSEAQTCGNGLRCVARYLWERDGRGRAFSIATAAGLVAAVVEPGPPFRARVDMGEPQIVERLQAGATIAAAGTTWRYAQVWTGNPHAVVFVDDVAGVDLDRAGAAIARDARFPEGANVHFTAVAGPHALTVLHYERGVGPTQACGSGAVAAAVAAIDCGAVSSPVTVRVPGGELTVAWKPGESATLEGPAEFEFERELSL